MTLQEIGALLRQERERQGKSIEEVMEATRISRRNLLAIEEGNESDLPHPVYAKGFLRSYARVLNLDSEELAHRLAATYPPEEADDHDPVTGRVEEEIRVQSAPGRKSSWLVILAILLLLGLLGWLVVWMMQAEPSREQASQAPPPVEEPLQEAPVDQPPAAATEEGPEISPEEPTGKESAEEPSGRESVEESTQGPAPEAAPREAAEAAAEPVEPRLLRIVAHENNECWMQVRLDDGQIREAYIQNGQSVAFTFDESAWLRLGNAGGVEVLLNGEPVDVDAVPGQVKTLSFP